MPAALLDIWADTFMPWLQGSITPALLEKDRGKVGRMSIPRTRMPSRRRCLRALTKSESLIIEQYRDLVECSEH